MSTGELCNQKQKILGKIVFCQHWKNHTGKHICHSHIKDQYGNELGAEISWPNFIGKDKTMPTHLEDKCVCGHARKEHGKSHSINYTEGICGKCDCQHFSM